MDDEYLTVAEVAERLNMNQQTVRNWIDRASRGSRSLAGAGQGGNRVGARAIALALSLLPAENLVGL
jgi:transposase-like protein